uniref:Uncharacterized protein n=1 Tax=Oryza punctata TaxID=4537 RepID=A0A0E0JVR8_ORYPU
MLTRGGGGRGAWQRRPARKGARAVGAGGGRPTVEAGGAGGDWQLDGGEGRRRWLSAEQRGGGASGGWGCGGRRGREGVLGSGKGRRRRKRKKVTVPSAQIELRGFDDSLRAVKNGVEKPTQRETQVGPNLGGERGGSA